MRGDDMNKSPIGNLFALSIFFATEARPGLREKGITPILVPNPKMNLSWLSIIKSSGGEPGLRI
jgi:hypothetical protein